MTDPDPAEPGEEIIEVRGVRFAPRPGTTDRGAIEECAGRRVYTGREIPLKPDEVWLDLGANVGGFALYAAACGCRVYAYEPVLDNLQRLAHNLQLNAAQQLQVYAYGEAVLAERPADGWVALAKPRSERNQYRYTTMPKGGWATQRVPAGSFSDKVAFCRPQGIKMDIEGAELAILDTLESQPGLLDGIKYLVGEYHLDYDPDLAAYHRRLDVLRDIFDVVKAPKLPAEGRFDRWPSGKVFRAWRS